MQVKENTNNVATVIFFKNRKSSEKTSLKYEQSILSTLT